MKIRNTTHIYTLNALCLHLVRFTDLMLSTAKVAKLSSSLLLICKIRKATKKKQEQQQIFSKANSSKPK